MVSVHILESPQLPADKARDIAQLLTQACNVSAQCTFKNVEQAQNLGELKNHFQASQEPAVVLFSAEDAHISIIATDLRNTSGNVVPVCLLTKKQMETLNPFEINTMSLLNQCESRVEQHQLINTVSFACKQATILDNLEQSAQLDSDTGLYNTRYFMNRLGVEISLAKRHLTPLATVVLGVGFYKMYQDSYGVNFTDALFKHLSDIVKEHIRHEDLVARVADDEIGILLPRSTEKGARVLASRIVESIGKRAFAFGDNTEELEAFAGISSYPVIDDDDANRETILRYARHALHNARCSDGDSPETSVQLFSEITPTL